MAKTVFEFIFRDIKWKLLALGLAFVLWFIGMNVNNPVTTRSFNRYLTLSHREMLERNNVVILNESQLSAMSIDIGIKATKNELDVLNTKSGSIVASVDLRAIDTSMVLQSDKPVVVSLEVDVDILLPGYERVNRIPNSVDVVLDKYVQQTRPVLSYAVGEVKDGYELQQVKGAYETVQISGARSDVDKVQTVRVQVNIQDADANINRVERLVAYDVNDNDITGTVELSVQEMNVHVSLLPYKTIPLAVSTSNINMPADGYTVTNVEIEPQSIQIVGTAEVLEAMRELTLEGINLRNQSESFSTVLDIRQALDGTGATLKHGEPTEATVTVKLERRIIKEIQFPIAEIRTVGSPAGASVSILNEGSVAISVLGTETAIAALTADRLNVQLQLYGLDSGDHSVPLNITLPREYTLTGSLPELTVRITPSDGANNPEADVPADEDEHSSAEQ